MASRRRRIRIAAAALAVAAAAGTAMAYPRPSTGTPRWELVFEPGDLRLYVDPVADQAYWYLTYEVTNRTGDAKSVLRCRARLPIRRREAW